MYVSICVLYASYNKKNREIEFSCQKISNTGEELVSKECEEVLKSKDISFSLKSNKYLKKIEKLPSAKIVRDWRTYPLIFLTKYFLVH